VYASVVRKQQAKVVEELIEKFEKKLGDSDVKATLGDYIRLLQLRRELDEEEPREIEVKWVDPEKKKPGPEKGE
jgi:hypothetical protein